MMGTGPFALPTLERLYESEHVVAALVTRPARPAAGRTPPPPSPMRAAAAANGTIVIDPESINDAAARATLAEFRPDLLVVCDYGQILSPDTLAVARLGGINLHASLLPKYRGAAPINWALYHGETETGVSVIHMTPKLDAGPLIAVARTPIGADETAVELEARLAMLGAPLVLQSIELLAAGRAKPIAQDFSLATRAPRLKKTDGQVNWSRPARAIRNQVRALQPWPKTYTCWLRPVGEPLRLILESVSMAPGVAPAPPGTVLETAGDRLVVAAGADALAVELLQPAGKRVLSAAEFLRGYPVRVGERFGQ
jgi:methionyl-tRNA formyltransferase